MTQKLRLVVTGNGMVGQRLLEQLCARNAADFDITVLCEEPRPAYDRVQLSAFFAGKTAEDLSLVPPRLLRDSRASHCAWARARSPSIVSGAS